MSARSSGRADAGLLPAPARTRTQHSPARPRVAWVVPGFAPHDGDWCIPALSHLARALAPACDLYVLALRHPFPAGRYRAHGAIVQSLAGLGGPGPRRWAHALRALAAAHHERPLVAVHGFWADEPGLVAALAGRLLRVPSLVQCAGGELVALPALGYGDRRRWRGRVTVALALGLATEVAVGSRVMLRLLWRHHATAARRSRILPFGVDLARFRPAAASGDRSGALRLINVGSCYPVKGQAIVLAALARLRRGGVEATLTLVGDGPLRGVLAARAAALGLDGAVQLVPAVPHHELPALLGEHDAFVAGSWHEAQGMALLEAAGCGLAAASTAVGVAPEVLGPARAVPPGSVEELAAALAPLVESARRWGEGSALRKNVAARFELGHCAGALLARYGSEFAVTSRVASGLQC